MQNIALIGPEEQLVNPELPAQRILAQGQKANGGHRRGARASGWQPRKVAGRQPEHDAAQHEGERRVRLHRGEPRNDRFQAADAERPARQHERTDDDRHRRHPPGQHQRLVPERR